MYIHKSGNGVSVFVTRREINAASSTQVNQDRLARALNLAGLLGSVENVEGGVRIESPDPRRLGGLMKKIEFLNKIDYQK